MTKNDYLLQVNAKNGLGIFQILQNLTTFDYTNGSNLILKTVCFRGGNSGVWKNLKN